MNKPSPSSHSSLTPDLRIVATEKLLPHEYHDRQRLEPLIERFRSEDFLINPPIVSEIGDARYVVLDGANRTSAFSELGIPHCLVQVVDYAPPATILLAHSHLVVGMDGTHLDRNIAAIEGLTIGETDITQARELLAQDKILAYYIQRDGKVATTLAGDMALQRRTELLNHIVDAYRDFGSLERVTTDDMQELTAGFPSASAVISFVCYQPDEIKQIAREEGSKLPPGITRHIINGRAIRINFPIRTLAAERAIEEKQALLTTWLQFKLKNREVRLYPESTYIFDE